MPFKLKRHLPGLLLLIPSTLLLFLQSSYAPLSFPSSPPKKWIVEFDYIQITDAFAGDTQTAYRVQIGVVWRRIYDSPSFLASNITKIHDDFGTFYPLTYADWNGSGADFRAAERSTLGIPDAHVEYSQPIATLGENSEILIRIYVQVSRITFGPNPSQAEWEDMLAFTPNTWYNSNLTYSKFGGSLMIAYRIVAA